MIFILLLLSFATNFAIVHTGLLPYAPGMTGSLIPGVTAQEFARQGALKSLLALIVVTGILALLLFGGIGVLPLKRNAPRRAQLIKKAKAF